MMLPHDAFGTHLDGNGVTVDVELEKLNFFSAAETLSEIWLRMVIDGHDVDVQAVPLNQKFIAPIPDPAWVSKHVQQSRYLLQIVKCRDITCCTPCVTNWFQIFPERFLPLPAIYEYGKKGLCAVEPDQYYENPRKFTFAPLHQRLLAGKLPDKAYEHTIAPFDLYCPSMVDKLNNSICPECNMYWPSAAAMKHYKVCQCAHKAVSTEEDELEEDMLELHDWPQANAIIDSADNSDAMHVFNIFEILQNHSFIEDEE